MNDFAVAPTGPLDAVCLLPAGNLHIAPADDDEGARHLPNDPIRMPARARADMTAVQRTKRMATTALRHAWRLIVLVVGFTVVAIGAAMIVLPGPAFVVIPVGLAILATEFVWARHLLDTLKERGRQLVRKATRNDREA